MTHSNLQLQQVLLECKQLKQENKKLKELLKKHDICYEDQPPNRTSRTNKNQIIQERINLFSSLFKGRKDAYARRWESAKNGTSGYSPACKHEWHPTLCKKPHIKCSQCMNKAYLPFTDQVVYEHLSGKKTIGVYPLLDNDICFFLAIDFDKGSWEKDVKAFLNICKELDIPAAVERSRSGNGAHVWIFFEEAVKASLARKLGHTLLSRTMEQYFALGMESFDRLFPNQDTLPKGGLGNLIALPLQGESRKKENSIFLNDQFEPIADQWLYLSNLRKMSVENLKYVVKTSTSTFVRNETITKDIPEKITLTIKNGVFINKRELPAFILKKFMDAAVLKNPAFYKAQAKRLSTHQIPRVINCSEQTDDHLILPRGCLENVLSICGEYDISYSIQDETFVGDRLNTEFKGALILGLTATPTRKDGLHPIMTMQCGPIRYKVSAKEQAKVHTFDHILLPRLIKSAKKKEDATIQELMNELQTDEKRNALIFNDVLQALEEGRSPIILTERQKHIDLLTEKLKGFAKNIIVLKGGLGKKEEKARLLQLKETPDDEERVIIATGKYIGEGFDDPRLDTLFLTMPVSWKGTLQQYVGRLHRAYHSKKDVKVYDYVDRNIPMLEKMYEKRLKGYQSLGYKVKGKEEDQEEQMKLF